MNAVEDLGSLAGDAVGPTKLAIRQPILLNDKVWRDGKNWAEISFYPSGMVPGVSLHVTVPGNLSWHTRCPIVAPQWGPEPDRMVTMDKSEHNKPEIGRKDVQTRHRYPKSSRDVVHGPCWNETSKGGVVLEFHRFHFRHDLP